MNSFTLLTKAINDGLFSCVECLDDSLRPRMDGFSKFVDSSKPLIEAIKEVLSKKDSASGSSSSSSFCRLSLKL